MFEKNMLTFNPGRDADAKEVNSFKEIRVLQEELREKDIEFLEKADFSTKGLASFIIGDPDENPILVDQHR